MGTGSEGSVPGWYGKLPCLGDFGSRRLSTDWIARWDVWLCEVLQALRDRLGDRWREVYLCSPIWCFAVRPGVIDEQGWSGVVMPSVDRVGRLFPLTIAMPLTEYPAEFGQVDLLRRRLATLSGVALTALDAGRTLDALESDLAQYGTRVAGPMPSMPPGTQDGVGLLASVSATGADVQRLHRLFQETGAARHGDAGDGVWWTDEQAEIVLEPCAAIGLPDADNVARRLAVLLEE